MSDAALSAEELAALRDASQDFAATEPPEGGVAGAREPKPVQLAAPDRQARRRLPALEPRLPILLRAHRHIVSTEMRVSLDVAFSTPEVASPSRMAAEVTSWQYGAVLRLKEHAEPIAWIGLPYEIAFHLIEVAYGVAAGSPGPLPGRRQLTAIERETLQPFLQQVADAFSRDLHFSRIGPTELVLLPYPPKFDGLRTQESGVVLRLQIPMAQGTLPYTLVLLPKALEQVEPDEKNAVATEARVKRDQLIENVCNAEVDVAAHLGTVSVSVATLNNLRSGQVIWLEHNQSEPIELLVEGQPKFTAMPMQRAGAVGVAIVERI